MIKIYLDYSVHKDFCLWYDKYTKYKHAVGLQEKIIGDIPCYIPACNDGSDGVEVFIPIEHYLHITETLEEGQN